MSIETKTEDRLEDATIDENIDARADITSGGLIGAVGGGIIGALAGGPLGAVIGAVVGGGASAAAVDYVEHHEHTATVQEDNAPTDGYQPVVAFIEATVVEPVNDILILEELTCDDVEQIEQSVRLRAYLLWDERGRRDGYALDDWLEAERGILTGSEQGYDNDPDLTPDPIVVIAPA